MPPFRASRIYLMLAILKPFEQNFKLWREPCTCVRFWATQQMRQPIRNKPAVRKDND